jgi:L-fucose isomerase
MNDPYDWHGKKEPTVCATEADAYAALTMQLMKYASGGLPTLFMDVRLYHPDLDIWDWCNSGNHASYYAALATDPAENLKHVTLHPALELYFKAGGASVEFDAAPGEYTFARLGLYDDKPFMVMMKGRQEKLSKKKRQELNAQTDPTWPHVHAKLEATFDEFLQVFPCNHVLGVQGDVLARLATICELSGIVPIILGPEGESRIPPIWERIA